MEKIKCVNSSNGYRQEGITENISLGLDKTGSLDRLIFCVQIRIIIRYPAIFLGFLAGQSS